MLIVDSNMMAALTNVFVGAAIAFLSWIVKQYLEKKKEKARRKERKARVDPRFSLELIGFGATSTPKGHLQDFDVNLINLGGSARNVSLVISVVEKPIRFLRFPAYTNQCFSFRSEEDGHFGCVSISVSAVNVDGESYKQNLGLRWVGDTYQAF